MSKGGKYMSTGGRYIYEQRRKIYENRRKRAGKVNIWVEEERYEQGKKYMRNMSRGGKYMRIEGRDFE
jgi:hypothetical protein